ncbi:hypothetical protein HYZ41_04795 [archaeon]|nr:hypothetical protein [archaeon]
MSIEDFRPVKLEICVSSNDAGSYHFTLYGKVFPGQSISEGWIEYNSGYDLQKLKERVQYYKDISHLSNDKIIVQQYPKIIQPAFPKGIFNRENMKKLHKYLVSESEPLPRFNFS